MLLNQLQHLQKMQKNSTNNSSSQAFQEIKNIANDMDNAIAIENREQEEVKSISEEMLEKKNYKSNYLGIKLEYPLTGYYLLKNQI